MNPVERAASASGVNIPNALGREVLDAYGGSGRRYHDTRHLAEVLERFTEVGRAVGWTRPREALLALLYHDAVYVPGAVDNESRSADLARSGIERFLPTGEVDVERVASWILLTTAHGHVDASAMEPDAALLLDCDMSILGSSPARYDAYEADIRQEYSALPPEVFAAGRAAFLRHLLDSPRIFLSPYFHGRLEDAARANLRRALAGALGA